MAVLLAILILDFLFSVTTFTSAVCSHCTARPTGCAVTAVPSLHTHSRPCRLSTAFHSLLS
jgi:hypothetical protein